MNEEGEDMKSKGSVRSEIDQLLQEVLGKAKTMDDLEDDFGNKMYSDYNILSESLTECLAVMGMLNGIISRYPQLQEEAAGPLSQCSSIGNKVLEQIKKLHFNKIEVTIEEVEE